MQNRGKERTGQGKEKHGENGCVTSGEVKMGRDIIAFKKINYERKKERTLEVVSCSK